MKAHLRACLLLLVLTVVICCLLYPLVLYTVGQGLFPTAAAGSLVADGDQLRGSRLIAQSFTADEYFWPRPSAASYNGTASGGSNWGANNPKLRDRVSQFLGANVQYKKTSRFYTGADPAHAVQRDIETWFAATPSRLTEWAAEFETAAANWKQASGISADDADFFTNFAKANPAKWPGVVEVEQPDKTKIKRIEPTSSDAAISANLFELWLRDPANADRAADLEPVAADMVTASGSGLDPHITLRNALSVYQLDRVAAKRTPTPGDGPKVRDEIAALVRNSAFTPLTGLVGEPLVNVLELNLALDKAFPVPPTSGPR
ncbi:potassium-transporting ATPase subunit C [Limnoglobus roseus]|uniref:Potassium-transporting ATPase KdpC subunit n=1 Tax=Limnoglobus roseus TaxID=2598579 RepID=A0A5C1A2N8_9BACT|nr:potassium-transporting ATPase subunit C [Limnoglobus roseus]QEL13401.1 potassium-transporting ATPase subunit C [Limnoglobus roseus]